MIMEKRNRGFEPLRAQHDNDELILPRRMTSGSAAYDLFSLEDTDIMPGRKHAFRLGIKAYMQGDEALFIITRSGNGAKRRITLANNVGCIDSDYYDNPDNEGEIIVMLVNDGTENFKVRKGDSIAQAFFQKILFVDDDCPLDKNRKGGFGSTTI